jgi:sugar/nucleoside kinase (ribokinase family)
MNLTSKLDVLGLGAVTIDDLIYVEAYPPADAKVPVRRSERHCGGLTGTALVAAARLGMKTAYAGVLGTDQLSTYLSESMKEQGVDMSHALRRPGVYPIHAVIIVDETSHTRNVFVDLSGSSGADASHPPEELLRSTKVLFVDHIGVPGMIRAATICRKHNIPIVADFERVPTPEFAQLLDLVGHLIVSQSFAEKLTGQSNPAVACLALWQAQRDTVVVTAGAAGAWYLSKGMQSQVQHQPAFQASIVDTTGCGDVFHGAYAAALAERLPLSQRIIFASAAAALKATKPGGQSGIPNRATVNAFLKQQQSINDLIASTK